MFIIATLISFAIQVYILIIVVQVALSWLIAFEIINEKNDAAQNLTALTKRFTDPVYTPIRKYIPPIGGIDITPLVVIIGLQLLGGLLISLLY
ncbi:MAG: YggT family protein [Alphaproteobacteria bacterium]